MESDDDCPPDLVHVEALPTDSLATSDISSPATPGGPSTAELPEDQTAAASAAALDREADSSLEVGRQANGEEQEPGETAKAVPVTILTGFLGAGKTTMLNYILTQEHGRRIAVIENEVGDSMDIEALIAKDGADGSMLADNLFELKNGCICCTVKDDLVTTLEALLQRRNKFDYVIIETTGLANPGPVASVFWLDEALESSLRLDGIVTLVDAKNIRRQLQRTPAGTPVPGEANTTATGEASDESMSKSEAAMQVAYADRLLVNKTDLVSAEDLDDVVAHVRAINAVAEVRCTERSAVDLSWVLDTRCFSPEFALAVDPRLDTATDPTAARSEDGKLDGGHSPGTDHVHGEDCEECARKTDDGEVACSVHDPAVSTCKVDLGGSVHLPRLERWLGGLLWDPPPGGREVYRVKGIVSVVGRNERFVVQGVADLFDVTPAGANGSAWREGEARRCKLVFIGRYLRRNELERGVRSCLVEAAA